MINGIDVGAKVRQEEADERYTVVSTTDNMTVMSLKEGEQQAKEVVLVEVAQLVLLYLEVLI